MLNYINGTINASRVLSFNSAAVYNGENNSNILKINISTWKLNNASGYSLKIETSPHDDTVTGPKITSSSTGSAYISGDYLYYSLPESLLNRGFLRVQIIAYRGEGTNEISQKSSIAEIEIAPSIE